MILKERAWKKKGWNGNFVQEALVVVRIVGR